MYIEEIMIYSPNAYIYIYILPLYIYIYITRPDAFDNSLLQAFIESK